MNKINGRSSIEKLKKKVEAGKKAYQARLLKLKEEIFTGTSTATTATTSGTSTTTTATTPSTTTANTPGSSSANLLMSTCMVLDRW